MEPTVCLSMIVKNESKIIARAFDSVVSIIDTFCICDTGSTDNTIEVMKEYFDKKGIKGQIIEIPFKNFGYNRTKAYEVARTMADYVVFLDADMLYEISPEFSKKQLTKNGHTVTWKCGTVLYANYGFIKSTVAAISRGPVHEYWDVPGDKERLSTLRVVDVGDGGNHGENKYKWHLKLLNEGLEEDPTNDRYQFYLANTYFCLGEYENAEKAYEKRIKMGGWIEETWYSYLKIGSCNFALNRPERAIKKIMKGYEIYPTRSEAIYNIVKHYRQKGDCKLAEEYYNIGKSIKYPANDSLFVDAAIYNYLFDYEYLIFNFYNTDVKNAAYKDKMVRLAQDIMNKCDMPDIYNNTVYNIRFYMLSIPDGKKIKIKKKKILYLKNTMYPCTPSIVRYIDENNEENYYVIQRYVNYKFNIETKYHDFQNNQNFTLNRLIKYDKNFKILTEKVIEPTIIEEGAAFNLLEDVKMFQRGKKIHILGTSNYYPYHGHTVEIFKGELNLDTNDFEYKVIKSPIDAPQEKNWVMFENNEKELKYVYKWYPIEIGRIEDSKFIQEKVVESPHSFRQVRGSTNGCVDPNDNTHIWFVVHFAEIMQNSHLHGEYYHLFVVLDSSTYKIIKYSRPIKFKSSTIEFCLGLIVDKDSIIVTHSTNDIKGYITQYERSTIDKLFN